MISNERVRPKPNPGSLRDLVSGWRQRREREADPPAGAICSRAAQGLLERLRLERRRQLAASNLKSLLPIRESRIRRRQLSLDPMMKPEAREQFDPGTSN